MQLLKITLNLLCLMISVEFKLLFFNKCQIILGRAYQTQ